MGPKQDKSKTAEKEERQRLTKLLNKSYNQLTKLKGWIESHGKSAKLEMAEVQLELIDNHYKRCFEYDEMITAMPELDDSEDDSGDEGSKSPDYEEVYIMSKSQLLAYIKQKSPAHQSSGSSDLNQSIVVATKPVQLPKLQLPKFSGKYDEWLDFKNEFTSMVIDDVNLTDVDRFRFLKSSLVEGARLTISQMEVSSENFRSAWAALVERYENKALMFQTHINEIILMPAMGNESAEGIREICDRVTAHFRALTSLGSKDELAENLLICLMLSKLDSTTAVKWEESTTKEIPTWDGFSTFLEKRASTLEKINYNEKQGSRSSLTPSATHSTNRNRRSHMALMSSNVSTSLCCAKCNSKEHGLANCPKFAELSPFERYHYIRKLRFCVLCLGGTHSMRNCRMSGCQRCNKRHHTMLHFETEHLNPTTESSTSASATSISNDITQKGLLVAVSNFEDESAVLATAIVNVLDNRGSLIPCRVLLDSGASCNFIARRFVQALNVKRHQFLTSIGGIGSSSVPSKGVCRITVIPRFGTAEEISISAVILQKITEAQPPYPISSKVVSIPDGIKLADPGYFKPQAVDLLIGAGTFWNLLLPGKKILGENLPVLQETKFGWTVSGPINYLRHHPKTSLTRNVDTNLSTVAMNKLDEMVKSFWEIEAYPVADIAISTKHQECESDFAFHTYRNVEGRYVVRLPFSKDPSHLGESRNVAMRRFLNLEKRLSRLPETKAAYAAFIREYQALNHLEVVNDFDPKSPHYFLPHHCVLKMTSSSTKLRVVFDGSCKTSSSVSLNDILHSGPKVQEDIFVILLRFRLFRYVLTGDIQKMYRQIQVAEVDRNFQLFLWRFKQDEPVQICRLCTVTYGTAPGAYLAIKTLHKLAEDEEKQFPIGARVLRQNFYVDDLMVGANQIEELLEIRQQIVNILATGGFSLSKFCSNEKAISDSIDSQLHEKFLKIDDHDVVKALGLIWEPISDVFRYSCHPSSSSEKITKRIVLSEMASLFDPLGLLCPVVVLAKIFYQDLWKQNFDWDKELNSELAAGWRRFRTQLSSLGAVSIPRFVFSHCRSNRIELHAFSDASEKAYAACVYMRSWSNNDEPVIHLLCAKSRVAPTKTITIARLELLAAKLLADLVSHLKIKVLNDIIISAEYYWTDSLICLCWLNQEPHNWNTFVAHRVSKIQQITKVECWRHIPGEINPADIASRGAMSNELLNSSRWFTGPEFLYQAEENWPPPHKPIDDFEERRKLKTAFLGSHIPDVTDSMNFSVNFRGIRRSFVYVMRFIDRCRKPVLVKDKRQSLLRHQLAGVYTMIPLPTYSEEEEVEHRFLRSIQQAAFPCEYAKLSNNLAIPGTSNLRSLPPFIDDKGLLRVGGRIKKYYNKIH